MLRYAARPSELKRLRLRKIYTHLYRQLGPQRWWPARSTFEMIAGAILTQATNWHNVEKAISRLRRQRALQPQGLLALGRRGLEHAVRPARYFRQKAVRLRMFASWYLARYQGQARRLFAKRWRVVRQELLALHGIGPETADAILLYAGKQPVFVVDAYTQRIFRRHRLIGSAAGYEDTQRFVMKSLRGGERVYNEFHALLVALGKRYCHRRDPDCSRCPLRTFPHRVVEAHVT